MHTFCMKVFSPDLLCFQFGFVIFCHKIIGSKNVRKMLVKLTTGVTTQQIVLHNWPLF